MGLVLPQKTLVIPCGKTIKHYKEKGYEVIPFEPLLVNVQDLTEKSNQKVLVECDICHSRYYIPNSGFNIGFIDGKTYCNNCKHIKIQDTNNKKYGVKSTLNLQSVQEKIKKNKFRKI